MNPVLAVTEHVPEYIADLLAERKKLVTRLREVNISLAEAETMLDLFPPLAPRDGG